jgi:hypothetical protein
MTVEFQGLTFADNTARALYIGSSPAAKAEIARVMLATAGTAALKADMRAHEALHANDPAPAEPLISITFMKDATGSAMTVEQLTLQELTERIETTTAKSKDALPLIKMANFGDTKSKNGSLRYNANLLTITGVEADYDAKKMSFDDAVAIAEKAGLNSALYTTPSYTDAEPKWRLLCPTSGSLPAKERDRLIARINGLFGGIFAPESFTLSQPYYIGSINNNPMHRVVITKGDFIDQRSDLDAKAIGRPKATAKAAGAVGEVEVHGYEGHIALIGDGDGLRGFNATLLSATSAYAGEHGKNLDREKLKALLRAAVNAAPKMAGREWAVYLTDTYLDSAIDGAIEKFGDKPWPGGTDKGDNPLNVYPNVKALAANLGLTVYYDQFRCEEFIFGLDKAELNGRVSDRAVNYVRDQASKKFHFYPDKEMTREAITATATDNAKNPVVEWLDKLVWNDVDLFAHAPSKYLGAEDTPLSVASYRKTFVASVARIYKPGMKFDQRITLQGAQGIMKSTHVEDIAIERDLFTDAGEVGMDTKKYMEISKGRQIIEVPELAHSARMMAKDKAHLSKRSDSARLAYAHYNTDQARSWITIATVNPGAFLGDSTGERRTWHIEMTKYNRAEFLADKDQLYAQAVHLYKAGTEALYLDTDELKAAHGVLTQTLKVENEFVAMLENVSGERYVMHGVRGDQERISNPEIFKVLGLLNIDRMRMHDVGTKISEAMMTLGWARLAPTRYGAWPERARPAGKHRGYVRAWREPEIEARPATLCDDQGVPF